MQAQVLTAMLDELGKIAASYGSAGYMQSRRGTRSLRVDTLLGQSRSPQTQDQQPGYVEPNTVSQNPEQEQPQSPEMENEDMGKEADKNLKTKAMEGFVAARPYVASGVKAAIPAAMLGGIIRSRGSGLAKAMGAAGAVAGVGNEALERWAEKNKRRAISKKILAE